MRLTAKPGAHDGPYSIRALIQHYSMPTVLAIFYVQSASYLKLPMVSSKRYYKALFTQGRCERKPQSQPGQHGPTRQEKWPNRYWCKLQIKKELRCQKPQSKQSQFTCQTCQIPLCKPGLKDCWKAFHSQRNAPRRK